MESSTVVDFVIGEESFVVDVVRSITADPDISHRPQVVECVPADDTEAISEFVRITPKSSTRQLLVVPQLEDVNATNIRNLDFVFRLSDYGSIGGLHVVLTHNLVQHGLVADHRYSQTDWRRWISQRFHSHENKFNGVAFSGRLSRILVQSSDPTSSSRDVPTNVCKELRHLSVALDSERTLMSVYSVLALLLFPLLFCHIVILRKRFARTKK